MKILITGTTTGYVGRHLVRSAVSTGQKVFTLNNRTTPGVESPFGLIAVEETMKSLFDLCEFVYGVAE